MFAFWRRINTPEVLRLGQQLLQGFEFQGVQITRLVKYLARQRTDVPPMHASVLNSMQDVHQAAPRRTPLTDCQETLTHSRHTRSTHRSFYRALIFFSQHSPLGKLGPTQEGAAELLHIAHVSVVEVVPCLGKRHRETGRDSSQPPSAVLGPAWCSRSPSSPPSV